MNKIIQSLVKEIIRIEISGKKMVSGSLIDVGEDIIVLFNGMDYMYIPLHHIRSFEANTDNENNIQSPTELPSIVAEESQDDLTFEDVLTKAKGRLVEIYVSGNKSLHGTITGIMKNYIVFQSPIYKKMYIALEHIKWLIPLAQDYKLFGLDNNSVPLQSNSEKVTDTLESQVVQLKNNIVFLNVGERESFVGKINNIEQQIVEFHLENSSSVFLNLRHIKTLHLI